MTPCQRDAQPCPLHLHVISLVGEPEEDVLPDLARRLSALLHPWADHSIRHTHQRLTQPPPPGPSAPNRLGRHHRRNFSQCRRRRCRRSQALARLSSARLAPRRRRRRWALPPSIAGGRLPVNDGDAIAAAAACRAVRAARALAVRVFVQARLPLPHLGPRVRAAGPGKRRRRQQQHGGNQRQAPATRTLRMLMVVCGALLQVYTLSS